MAVPRRGTPNGSTIRAAIWLRSPPDRCSGVWAGKISAPPTTIAPRRCPRSTSACWTVSSPGGSTTAAIPTDRTGNISSRGSISSSSTPRQVRARLEERDSVERDGVGRRREIAPDGSGGGDRAQREPEALDRQPAVVADLGHRGEELLPRDVAGA